MYSPEQVDELIREVKTLRAQLRYDRAHLMQVIIYHQRKDIGSCICGWGVDTGQLGKSHAAHVLDVYEQERRLAGG